MITVSQPQLVEGAFWFAVVGAAGASLNHALRPFTTIQQLTPSSVIRAKLLHPGAEFWGSKAFSIMNLGMVASGLWAAYTGSVQAKQGQLLSTGCLFWSFAAVWIWDGGRLTGNPRSSLQGLKVFGIGSIFMAAFATSLYLY